MTLSDVQAGDPHVAAHNAERDAINDLDVLAQTLRDLSDSQFSAALSAAFAPLHSVTAEQQAAITSAVNALIAGAPGARDTLKELSDQLSADESAATALTNLVTNLRNLTDATQNTALSAAYLSTVDGLSLTRMERQEESKLRVLSQKIRTRCDDALQAAITDPLTDLNGWTAVTNMTASGNYAGGTAAGTWQAQRAISVPANGRFIARCLIKSGGNNGGVVYVGINNDAAGAGAITTNTPNAVAMGKQSTGNSSNFRGANVSATGFENGSNVAMPAGDYIATIVIDEINVAISLHSAAGVFLSVLRCPRSSLPGGPVINNIFVLGVGAFSAGDGVGPFFMCQEMLIPVATAHRVVGGKTLFASNLPIDYKRVDGTSGFAHWLRIPGSYDYRVPTPIVSHFHGATALGVTMYTNTTKEFTVVTALTNAGYIVVASDGGPSGGTTDRFGNQIGIDDHVALHNYARAHFNPGPSFLWGVSMGGEFVENILSQRALGGIAAVALCCPGLDLVAAEANSTYTAGIRAAYGAADHAAFMTAIAGKNPIDLPGYALRGVPQKFWVASDDAIAPPATYVEPLRTRLLTYAVEASEVATTGGHVAVSTYDGPGVVAFFDKYR